MQMVLAIAGSLRRGSYNRLLLRASAASRPAQMTIDLYDELGSIPLFNEDLEDEGNGAPPAVARLRRLVRECHGVLIATPEYNWSLPAALKNAIDWLSRPVSADVIAGKPFAIVGATAGRWGTRLSQAALRQVLCATESAVMPAPALFVSEAARLFDAEGELIDGATRAQLGAVLSAFSGWIAACQGAH